MTNYANMDLAEMHLAYSSEPVQQLLFVELNLGDVLPTLIS